VREGGFTGAATMPQPSTLRLLLIDNAATLASASPTLLSATGRMHPLETERVRLVAL